MLPRTWEDSSEAVCLADDRISLEAVGREVWVWAGREEVRRVHEARAHVKLPRSLLADGKLVRIMARRDFQKVSVSAVASRAASYPHSRSRTNASRTWSPVIILTSTPKSCARLMVSAVS